MEWRKLVTNDWWFVIGVCYIYVVEGEYYVGSWGGRGHFPARYPTLEAAKLAAEMLFG